MQHIAVVDYGMGNLRSVEKALEHVADHATIAVTADPDTILSADRVVFPGQGAARDCMRELNDRGLPEVIREAAQTKPFLGVCMGMQVLMQHSDENHGIDCLGLFDGQVKHFTSAWEQPLDLKIPHMGWNQVQQQSAHPLWQGVPQNSRFYFVHSYFVSPDDACLVEGETEYGHHFASVIAKENVFAIQAHPEKSADAGLQLLTNFCRWDG